MRESCLEISTLFLPDTASRACFFLPSRGCVSHPSVRTARSPGILQNSVREFRYTGMLCFGKKNLGKNNFTFNPSHYIVPINCYHLPNIKYVNTVFNLMNLVNSKKNPLHTCVYVFVGAPNFSKIT